MRTDGSDLLNFVAAATEDIKYPSSHKLALLEAKPWHQSFTTFNQQGKKYLNDCGIEYLQACIVIILYRREYLFEEVLHG